MKNMTVDFGARLIAQYRRNAPPVTILLGYTFGRATKSDGTPAKGTIVLASDSQITGSSSLTSRTGTTPKIVEIEFANTTALLAKAGRQVATDRFEELFQERAKDRKVKTPREIATLAEDAIRVLGTELADRNGGDLGQHLLDHECGFLLAYHFEGIPYIYSITLGSKVAVRAKTGMVTMGCAATLADFLLTGFQRDPDLSKFLNEINRSMDVAHTVVELCKLHDSACGGHVQIGTSFADEKALVIPKLTRRCPQSILADHDKYHDFLVRKLEKLKKIGKEKPIDWDLVLDRGLAAIKAGSHGRAKAKK